MKPIKLTEEHKTKLLEMCKVLFFKSNFKIIGCLLISFEYNKVEGDEVFHWFEFCMTHLAEEIDCDLSHNIIYMKKHPVDYLYQEFKKLK